MAGFPDRIVPVSEKAAAILKKRTLTNLYNERPAWLDNAHRDLDAAVAAAYGWPADIGEDDGARPLARVEPRARGGGAVRVESAPHPALSPLAGRGSKSAHYPINLHYSLSPPPRSV